LNLETSFSGQDVLVSAIEAGNFSSSGSFSTGNTALEAVNNSGNALELATLYYQRPVGEDFTVTVGPLLEQADLLGAWAGSYPSDTILDVLTYAGANAAYNNSSGAGVGITYARDRVSASLLYVAEEANDANVVTGGLLTEGGSDDFTAQVAWLGDDYTVALAYTFSDGGVDDGFASNEHFDAWGLTGEWNPDHDQKYLPDSISAGLGIKEPSTSDDANDIEYSRTWTVGLLWSDLWVDGNTLGLGVGSAEPWIEDSWYDDPIAYELYYSMAVSDNITVTPAIFHVEVDNSEEFTGALVKTTFSF